MGIAWNAGQDAARLMVLVAAWRDELAREWDGRLCSGMIRARVMRRPAVWIIGQHNLVSGDEFHELGSFCAELEGHQQSAFPL